MAITLFICCNTFKHDDAEESFKTLGQFYELEKNTVDCIYLGSSSAQRCYANPIAFHDYGIAAYSLSSGAQPFVVTRFLMEEALKTQDPRLFVIELRGSCKGPEKISDPGFRTIVDNMKPSMTRFRAIKEVTEYASHGGDKNKIDHTGLSYYIPLIKYHSKWNPDKRPEHFEWEYYKGFTINPRFEFNIRRVHSLEYTEEKMPIAPETEEAVRKLLDYCDTLDAEVLFVVSPYEATEDGMKKINYTTDILNKRGYKVFNMLPDERREAIGVDDRTSYYNREHLNYHGTLLYTEYLSAYLKKHYSLPDRRGDQVYEEWEDDYKRLQYDTGQGEFAEKYKEMESEIEEIEAEER